MSPNTGNYADDTVKETPRYASVMNTGEDTLRLVYDGPKQGSLTIQIQNHYEEPFDRIRVGREGLQRGFFSVAPDKAYVCSIGGAVMGGIKVVGFEKLQKKLKQNVRMEDVKKVVRHNGAEMQAKAQQNAPVDTGTLKRSIGLEFTDGGMSAEVEPKADYGAYVELGTRKMEAQPYLKPAFEEQSNEFRKDMQNLVE